MWVTVERSIASSASTSSRVVSRPRTHSLTPTAAIGLICVAMAESNPPLSARIADFLEMVANRIRELSVDRAATGITWAAIGLILVVAGVTAVFWLLVGIFRVLGTLIGTETAYAVVGLALILVGAFVWSRRFPQDRTSQQE